MAATRLASLFFLFSILTIRVHSKWYKVPMYHGFTLAAQASQESWEVSLEGCLDRIRVPETKAVEFDHVSKRCSLYSTVFQAAYSPELARNKTKSVFVMIDENETSFCDKNKVALESELEKIVSCRGGWQERRENGRVYCYRVLIAAGRLEWDNPGHWSHLDHFDDRNLDNFVKNDCTEFARKRGYFNPESIRTASIHSAAELQFISTRFGRFLKEKEGLIVGILPQKGKDLRWIDGTPVGFNRAAFKQRMEHCIKNGCKVITLRQDEKSATIYDQITAKTQVLCKYEATELVNFRPTKPPLPE